MSNLETAAPLPCPFCGGQARTYRYDGTTQAVCAAKYVECAGSTCDAPVAMWNRRIALAVPGVDPKLDTDKSAIRRAALEEAARIADEYTDDLRTGDDDLSYYHDRGWTNSALCIARRIRAVAEKESGDGQ